MKNVYVVISETGSGPSRFLQYFTKDHYVHVSLGLNEELTEMYSFARRWRYYPFWSGFIRECINQGTYERFKDTRIAVIKLPVSEEVYEDVKAELRAMYPHRKKFRYNYIGVFLAHFGKLFQRKTCFYCSEFVQKILSEHGVGIEKKNLPVKPVDFLQLKNSKVIFEGLMREYAPAKA